MAEVLSKRTNVTSKYYLFDDLSKYTLTNIENFSSYEAKIVDGQLEGDLLTLEPIQTTRIIDVEPVFVTDNYMTGEGEPNYKVSLLVSFIVDGVELYHDAGSWVVSDGSASQSNFIFNSGIYEKLSENLFDSQIRDLIDESSEVSMRFHLLGDADSGKGAFAGVKVTHAYEPSQDDQVDRVNLFARIHNITGGHTEAGEVKVMIRPDNEFKYRLLKTTSGEIVAPFEKTFETSEEGFLATTIYPSDAYQGDPVTYTVTVGTHLETFYKVKSVTIPSASSEVDLGTIL